MRYPFGISCFFIRAKYNLQMFCLQSHQHCIFTTGCRELRLIFISDFLAIWGGGVGWLFPIRLKTRDGYTPTQFYPTFPTSARGTGSAFPSLEIQLWLSYLLFPLQYKSCIRRHAELFSKTCLDYKTCLTIYSKTRLKYRTQQPSVDLTMTSSLL